MLINWARIDKSRDWLEYAYQIAKETSNIFAESYVLIELSDRALKSGAIDLALDLAKLAQSKAQSQFSFDSIFKSSLLIARILSENGNKNEAITAYKQAITSLGEINASSITIDIENRINFSNQVEVVYRELLAILLDKNNFNEAELKEVLVLKDRLQLAQLQTFFGDNCFSLRNEIREKKINPLVEQNALVFSSIILKDSTHLILQTQDGNLFHHKIDLPESEIRKLALDWHQNLQQRNSRRFLSGSSKFYELLIRPFEVQLSTFDPSTIIFVNDSILRNLPMSALYNQANRTFFSESWASISSLGLNIQQTQVDVTRTAIFGLSEASNGFSSLDSISAEVSQLSKLTKGKSFLNKQFTSQQVLKELQSKNYSILHFATHGYFGGVRENSFILASDKPLFAENLEDFLSQSRSEIDLLVLSACETSVSSDLSVLGLSGVALRSGVRSVLGSFWLVQDDEQTELISQFYQGIKEEGKAIALQNLQKGQIELNAHPAKWAAFNLIGDL